MKGNFGFTLAEVLITLGILGIVMEMTIPTLMQNMAEKQTAGMLKKEYSILSQAYTRAVQENGTPDTWQLIGGSSGPGAVNMLNILKSNLKIIKNCGTGTGCLPNVTYKYLNKGDWYNEDSDASCAKAQLADGSLIRIWIRDKDCGGTSGSTLALNNICANVFVDINGFKNPNQIGMDTFFFHITKYGVVPAGINTEDGDSTYSFKDTCKDKTTGSGQGCTAWVLYNDNMDYLHCNNLSWTGPTKCQ